MAFESESSIEAESFWRQELHDLCQPLTRLQWRLELGQSASDAAGLRETVEGALADAKELTEWVRRMRLKTEVEQISAGRVA